VKCSSYYSFIQRLSSKPEDPEYEEMLVWVKDIAESSDHTYGSPRMSRALRILGCSVGRMKAKGLMREAGFQARRRKKYKVTTNRNHKLSLFENVLGRQFETGESALATLPNPV